MDPVNWGYLVHRAIDRIADVRLLPGHKPDFGEPPLYVFNTYSGELIRGSEKTINGPFTHGEAVQERAVLIAVDILVRLGWERGAALKAARKIGGRSGLRIAQAVYAAEQRRRLKAKRPPV